MAGRIEGKAALVTGAAPFDNSPAFGSTRNAVLPLASDESRYITGVTLSVDAGSCLK